MFKWILTIVAYFVGAFLLSGLLGCSTFQPYGFPKEIGQAAQQMGTSVADQAAWDRVMGRLAGQGIEPGTEAYAEIRYAAGVRLKGISGQFALEGDGHGTGELTPEARAVLLRLGEQPDLLDKLIKLYQAANPADTGVDQPHAPEPVTP